MSTYVSGGQLLPVKRAHRAPCEECRRKLTRGMYYRSIRLKDDCDGIYTYKLCGRCARWADMYDECEWAIGDIEEFRKESLQENWDARRKNYETNKTTNRAVAREVRV